MEKDIIFLDTNVFGRKEKYDFEHSYRNNILSMLKRYSNIEVYLPSIVVEELKKHIKESIDNDQNNIKSIYVKRKLPHNFYEETLQENLQKLNEFIEKNKIKILDCEKYLKISDVNRWYFNKEKPFETSKPKEFPDAMIISAIVNFLKENKYENVYIVSEDKGFNESIKSKIDCIIVNKLETILKEFFDFSTYEYRLVEDYIKANNILLNKNYLEFESANINDIINVNIEKYHLNTCEIIYDQKENESIVVKVNYNIGLSGEIFVFDPYESIYDKDDDEYIYPIYKTANQLDIKNLEIYIELFKDKNGNYRKHKVIDKALIDITNYLSEMKLHCKE
ncbi:MAG: DUF4935 domain-containing protein [Clostridia bacterium]|nr:DUF4935 domain-containing protein [Clostridia bacterium]